MKGIVLGFLWLNLIIGAVIYEKIKPVEVIKEVKIEVPVIKEVNTDFKEFKIKKETEQTYEVTFDQSFLWSLRT